MRLNGQNKMTVMDPLCKLHCIICRRLQSSVQPVLQNNASLTDREGTHIFHCLTLTVRKMKITEFANRADPDEVAHHEPPHLGLHCVDWTKQIFEILQL